MLTPPIRALLGVVGAFVLADSLSQLLVSLGAWEPGSGEWRVTTLRLVFTQVTPIVIAGLLLGIATVRSDAACRYAGLVTLALGVLVAGLAAILLADARPVPEADPTARGALQALTSAGAAVLGLTFASVLLLRAGRSGSPPPPRPDVA